MEGIKKTCIIVDDNNFARETLADLLDQYKEIDIIKSISDSQTAIKHIALLNPDLVFLDINMPKKNGMTVFNEIKELQIKSKIIFVTAYDEYLIEALKKEVFDYLIKPVRMTELEESIERFLKISDADTSMSIVSGEKNKNNKISIKNSHGSLFLNPKDIAYIEADGCYTKLHLKNNKTEVISKNLGKLESIFSKDEFFKISRSYIINLTYLNKINRLKREIQLSYNGVSLKLKASKLKLHELEKFITDLTSG